MTTVKLQLNEVKDTILTMRDILNEPGVYKHSNGVGVFDNDNKHRVVVIAPDTAIYLRSGTHVEKLQHINSGWESYRFIKTKDTVTLSIS